MTLKERAKQLQTDIPAVCLALRQRETPWYAKALAALTVAYALSPIDLVPDFIPVLGYLDDVLLLPALIALTVRCVPPAVMETCRAEAAAGLSKAGRKRWYYAVPIALVWAAVLFFIVRAILSAVNGRS